MRGGPFVVLLGGGTASGKTTIAHRLSLQTGALHIAHDRYYRDVPVPRGHNYDHPDALDTARLVADLARLRAGEVAELPVYDFPTHRRAPYTEPVSPRPLIVVEGILALHDAGLRANADLPVFVHAADDLRFARRVLRDVGERGRDVGGVVTQYLDTVRPMHHAFVEPSRAYARLVLDGEGDLELAVEALLAALPARGPSCE